MKAWTPLSLALAVSALALPVWGQEAGAPQPAPSSTPSSDTAAPAAQLVIEADDIINDDTNQQLIAEGNVVAVYEGRTMRADRVVYNLTTRRVYASGDVQIFDPDGSQRFADEIEADENFVDGYAVNFSTRLPDGAVATARSAVRSSDGTNALDKAIYTSCTVCEEDSTPTWALRANRAVLNQETQMISYRDAVLEIVGVPVLYLPFFAHPDPQSERRSGLLAPSFGASNTLGLFWQQPYLFVLSESSDITVAPAVYQNVNPLLAIDYRKRFWSGQLRVEGSITHESEFDNDGERFGEEATRSHIFADGRFAVSPTWEWGFSAERMSDDLYSRRYDISGEGKRRGLYDSQPLLLLSQLYGVGQTADFYADAALISIQGLRFADEQARLPVIAPLAFAERQFDFGRFGTLALSGSAAGLTVETGADSQRVSLGADWTASRVLPGGMVVSPFAQARADHYVLDEAVSGQSDVTRPVGTVGTTLAWPLVRPGKDLSLLVEPIVMAAWGTEAPNEDPIPVLDGLQFEVDESNIFDPAPVPGYDLYEGGGRIAAGFRAEANWSGGLQARALVGRRWREEADTAFDTFSNLSGTSSDWVTGLGVSYKSAYSLDARVRLDKDDLSPTRMDIRGSVNLWRINGAARYFRLDERINGGQSEEGIDVGGSFRLTDRVSLTYSQLRDLAGAPVTLVDPITNRIIRDPITGSILTETNPRDLRRAIGVAWSDECSVFQISLSRSEAVDRSIGPNDSIEFRFFLRSLGGLGDGDFD